MIFYTTNPEDLELVPSTYSVISLTDEPVNQGCKYVRLKQIMPMSSKSKSKEECKESYKKLLKDRKELVAYMVKEGLGNQCSSIVLYTTERDIKYYKFNFLKTLCKFISKRYNVKIFKFTTTVTKQMRLESHNKDDLGNLIDDCKKIYNSIVKQ